MPFIPRIVIDEDGHTHLLEVGNEMVLFDGVPASIEQLDQNAFRFKTRTVEATIEASALGAAFAGTDPTLAAVGFLFGAYLGSLAQQQSLAQSLQRVNNEITSLCGRLTSGGSLIFPQSHFDPITERALRLFDGTDKITTVIASILGQPAPLVRAWAAQIPPLPDLSVAEELGEEQPINGDDTSFSLEAEQQALSVEDDAGVSPNQEEIGDGSHSSSDLEGPTTGELSTLHLSRTWNAERLMQLEQALLTCDASTLKEAIEQVAPRFACTIGAIQGQVYTNGMNTRFKEMQKTRLSSSREKQTVSASDEQQNAVDFPHVFSLNEETPLCLESSEEESAPGIEIDGLTQSLTPASEAFTWSNDTIQQLRTAFLESQASTRITTCEEIALQFGWPLRSVTNKVSSLGLWGLRQQQQQQATLAAQLSLIPKNDLQQGSYGWRIEIGSEVTQWYLGYCYGEFPARYQGQEIRQNGQLYRVERIFSQGLRLVKQTLLSVDTIVPAQISVASS